VRVRGPAAGDIHDKLDAVLAENVACDKTEISTQETMGRDVLDDVAHAGGAGSMYTSRPGHRHGDGISVKLYKRGDMTSCMTWRMRGRGRGRGRRGAGVKYMRERTEAALHEGVRVLLAGPDSRLPFIST